MTKRAFLNAVERAAPGERIVYHTGLLAYDRMPKLDGTWPQASRDADAVAGMAWLIGAPKDFGAGWGHRDAGLGAGQLLQRRTGQNSFEYALTMRRRISADEMAFLRSTHRQAA